MSAELALSIDFGTSNTVAVLRRADGTAEALLFDGSPLLPSAVFAQPDGSLLAGRDAIHSARLAPERFEPNPKLRVDDGAVLLGAEVPVAALFAAVLERVATEARRVAGSPAARVVLTHPAGWGPRRRAVLVEAAGRAGLGEVTLEAEPVAAARSFVRRYGPDGDAPVVVYDFGGGTFDVSVVAGTRVLAAEGLTDAGGLDIDAALVAYLDATYRERDPEAWGRLRDPATPDDRRAWRQFAEDVRAAKEMLSRTGQAFVHVPLLGVDAPIGREQVEAIATPLIARTVAATRAAIAAAGLPLPPTGPVYLVGGASRMPLVATMLLRRFRVAPTVAEQPELVVAHGALPAAGGTPPTPSGTPVAAAGATSEPGDPSPVEAERDLGPGRAATPSPEPTVSRRPAVPPGTVLSDPVVPGEPGARHDPVAGESGTPVAFGKGRAAVAAETMGFPVALVVVIAIVGAASGLITGHGASWWLVYFAQLVLSLAVAGLLGGLVGLARRATVLRVGPDGLSFVRTGRRPTATAIRWGAVQRVRLIGDGNDARLAVWYREGHQPDPSFDYEGRYADGWVVCRTGGVIGRETTAEMVAGMRAALTRFAGNRYDPESAGQRS